jgi:hypothetical protein
MISECARGATEQEGVFWKSRLSACVAAKASANNQAAGPRALNILLVPQYPLWQWIRAHFSVNCRFQSLTRLGIDTARFRDMARRRPPRQLQQSDIGASY